MFQDYVRVVFIDSGVDKEHPALKNIQLNGITICDDGTIQNGVYDDKLGHGTGVVYSFYREYPFANCFIIKIFDSLDEIDEEKLIWALHYVRDNIACEVVNISCGLSRVYNYSELHKACEDLYSEGKIIVSGFDNGGTLSYPAAFDHVIGVDISTSCVQRRALQYVESRLVNVRGFGYSQKLPCQKRGYCLQSGSSFVVPFVSALIAKNWAKKCDTLDKVCAMLKQYSYRQFSPLPPKACSKLFQISRAALFPFNKEMHALLSFSADIGFDIVDVYDLRQNGKIGKHISEEVYTYHIKSDYLIKSVESIDWDRFDTFILGHTSKIEEIIGYEIKQHLISECIFHKKNIYFFDSEKIDDNLRDEMGKHILYYDPEVDESHVREDQFGKLYEIGKPVLGFWGTGPKQGKLTTQMLTKFYLKSQGYSVGALGTEPNALLLGYDEQYNMGFNSSVRIRGEQAIQYINGLMRAIESKNPDIIFVGSQSQTVSLTTGNIGFYPYSQYELLLATQPDAIVLNVNIFDDEQYIFRTVQFLESVCEAKVICLVMYPIQFDNYQGHLVGKGTSFDMHTLNRRLAEISAVLKKPTFLLDNEVGTKVGQLCIEYFTKEGE